MAITQRSPFILAIALSLCALIACQPKKYRDEIYIKPTINANPEIKSLSPEESRQRMYLPKGYRIELVASEPMIHEPVAIAWDGNGKMYVAQMMTYMQDIDAGNEDKPWSRISVLEDTDGDGKMDKSSVFIDSMVLPRIMLPLDDRIIVGETFQRNLYSYRDTNGDGKADEKKLLLEDTVRDNRNLEHQDANMIWSLDNWLYVTNKAFRYRFIDNKLVRDTLPEPALGQWGLTQDETGRLFFSRAGAEIPALGFQQHPAYGSLELEGKWDESFMEPWPIVGTLDAQGGPRRIRVGESTLNRFTGVAGQEIFLGDKMPLAYGDLFIPEPVGRLVRRAKVNHVDGKIILENPYKQTEFLASTDPLFRPVNAATGPDGCLYVVDMYRGIIQEGTWVGEGSYLRGVAKEKGYDKFFGRGRIYRIVHEDMKPGPKPDLLNKTAKELLPFLGHSNGWWRNTAQKLIILKGDKSVAADLIQKVKDNESFFATFFNPDKDFGLERLHSLWTLEGLDAIDKSVLKIALNDKDPRVKVGAIRISDRYLKQHDFEVFEMLKPLANDKDPEVLQQLILSLRIINDKSNALVKSILVSHPNNEVIKVTASENLNPSFSVIQQLKEKYKLKGGDAASQIVHGYKIFKEYCSTCHGIDGKGIKQLAPSLVGSPRVKGDIKVPIKILLNGLTGPVDGVEYNGPMASVAKENDQYIADVLTYVRTHLNNEGGIWFGQIRGIREKTKERNKYWTLKELEAEQKLEKK
jgi:mono/diheme cytochrome c family protein/glucose/arabinose dehydrogenase